MNYLEDWWENLTTNAKQDAYDAYKRTGTEASSPAAGSRNAERGAGQPEGTSGGKEERLTGAEEAADVRGRKEELEAAIGEALQSCWGEFVADTGCMPSCFEWRGGNGKLYADFIGSAFAEWAAIAAIEILCGPVTTGERSDDAPDPTRTLRHPAEVVADQWRKTEAERAANAASEPPRGVERSERKRT